MAIFGKYVTQGHWTSKWHSDSRVVTSFIKSSILSLPAVDTFTGATLI